MINYLITKKQARLFLLQHQQLNPSILSGSKQSIYDYIRRVGCIQYDPLSITGHNHELVLQARIPGFTPELVQELLYQDRLLIDGWDKNMSIYCTEDWPYFQRSRELATSRYERNSEIMATVERVRRELTERGPLSSLDLEGKDKINWAWAPARLSRAALESMYFWGELVIHHRVHTRRYYDFTTRLLPESILERQDPNETEDQYYDWYVLRRIGSIGLQWNRSGDGWLGINGLKSKERTGAVQRLLHTDKIREVNVEGIKLPFYIRSIDAPVLEGILEETNEHGEDYSITSTATALAPLDNLLWDRELIKQLFDFEYRWEVYKPAAERQYGYYVLPLLYGDRFVARIEPVMDKKSGILTIINWWWELGESLSPELTLAIRDAMISLARCVRANSVQFLPEVVTKSGLQELIIMMPE
ncbi:MAG: winged helix DNA-binding domain-containing protein [Paenibacillus sp.]|nr:winged helix DNA-binding domain-containing protein [Paenibacillus sp.]